jgi:CHAT domain-containing protein
VVAWKGAVTARQLAQHDRGDSAKTGEQSELTRLDAEYRQVARQLASLALAVPAANRLTAWRDQIAALTARKEQLESELARRSAGFRAERQRAQVGPAEIRATLPRDVALVDLLEYDHSDPPAERRGKFVYERRLVAFVTRADRDVVRVDLGPATPLAAAVSRWRETLGQGAQAQQSALVLRQRVWEPLEQYLEGITTVLVSPDGALARMPLAALPGKGPGSYLIEERAIAVVAVPQLLPELLAGGAGRNSAGTPGGVQEPSLLLVGDVDFGAGPGVALAERSRAAARDLRAGAVGTFARLDATREEIVSVRDAFERLFRKARADVLREDEATESAFRREAPGHRYAHLATHGYFADAKFRSALNSAPSNTDGARQEIDPFGGRGVVGFHPGLLSGLAFVGANRPAGPGEDDGILTALEVAALDLGGVELVVLSACETGLGESAGGEGLLGLQRGFQVAGAHAVVASSWKVPDEPTRALMVRFYRNLWGERPMSKLEALCEAQRWMLREGRDRGLVPEDETTGPGGRRRRVPPRYWAAFVLSGDWR